ncbi:MAG: YlbF family regulator [Verrucomicrobiota bacterium]
MAAVIEDKNIKDKLVDLCQGIMDQPEFSEFNEAISSFSEDEEAQDLLSELTDLGAELRQMQSQGYQLPEDKTSAYDVLREKAQAHPICKPFMDAQSHIHSIQQTVMQHIAKTYELGRLPEADDFSCGCGTGCGCR